MELDVYLLKQIIELTKQYEHFIESADNTRRHENGKATKAECLFLQGAANCKSKILNLTNGSGSEWTKHKRDLDELNKRIKKVSEEIEGTAGNKGSDGTNGTNGTNSSNSSNSGTSNSSNNSGGTSQGGDDDLNIDPSEWQPGIPEHGFDKVSGMSSVMKKLKTCMIETALEKLSARLEMKQLNSYFFVGPPGCGKTYIIKAFVHELHKKYNYNYLYLDCAQIITKYVGDSEKIVKRVFEEAVKLAPCILFIDEIDGMCKNRSNPMLPEYASSLTTAFLTSYNIINEANKKIIFMGATNYPKNVDEAMLDRVEVVYVGLPDEESRVSAFKMAFCRKNKEEADESDDAPPLIYFAEDLDYEYMAERTRGYSRRDIDRVVENIKKYIFTSIANDITDAENDEDMVDKVIADIDSGNYLLTREMFDQVLSGFIPSNKTNIIRDIKEWMEQSRASDMSGMGANFPDITGLFDFEELAAEKAETAENETVPAEKAETAESETVPAEEAETAENETVPAEKAENAENETVPAEEAETAENETVPAEKAETAEIETAPAEKAETAEIETVPAEEAETAEIETVPVEEAETAENETVPAEEAETAVNETVPAEEAETAESETVPAEEAETAENEIVPAEEAETAETQSEAIPMTPVEESVSVDTEGKAEIRFYAPEGYSEPLSVMVMGEKTSFIQCGINGNIASFGYEPAANAEVLKFRVLDTEKFYGDISVALNRE